MTSISALIDFLMSLMRDDDTKRAFENDPDGTMAGKGLHNVSAQDVRDARLIMAEDGSARPRNDGGSHSSGYHEGGLGGGGTVREILHTTNTFEIDQSRHTSIGDIKQTIINIDDRDTTVIDSFNSQDTVTAIQDNDTVIDIHEDKDGPRDGDEQEPTPDPTDDLPNDPGPPPMDDTPPDEVPDLPGPPSDESDEPDVPMPETNDPGIDPGDGTDPFPTEPEPLHEEPVMAEADDLPVA